MLLDHTWSRLVHSDLWKEGSYNNTVVLYSIVLDLDSFVLNIEPSLISRQEYNSTGLVSFYKLPDSSICLHYLL